MPPNTNQTTIGTMENAYQATNKLRVTQRHRVTNQTTIGTTIANQDATTANDTR